LVYLFFAISAAWSPLGIIALKRLCKDFGTVLVALVLLTETDPFAATRTVFVRVSYLLFPLSVLVIKYYPAIGRNYSIQGGAMATGLTMQKNSLGEVVVVFGLMLVWDLLAMRNENADRRWKTGILIGFGMLAMGGWLLLTCDSVTSIMCFLLGLFILWGGGRLVRMQNGRKVIICWLFALACLIGLNKTFGISDVIIHAFGRNTDLTYRTYIWQAVWAQETDPLIGCGFYSFWDTQFGQNVNAALRVEGLRETHNGYLETFVDGGAVGEGLLIILLMTIGTRSIRRLFDGTFFGRMSLAFWAIAILSSVSEANFLRLGPIWFAFLLLTTECPRFMPAFEENDGPARVEGAVSQNA
jgi:O-antigen ligase